MKKLTVVLLVTVLVGTAMADTGKTGRPLGPMNLYVDDAGVGLLQNDGDVPFLFDGYTIMSEAGLIGTVVGIFDNAVADMVGFPGEIGLTLSEALAWTDLSKTASNFTEVTMGKGATLQPGDAINLGPAFLGMTPEDGTLTYVNSEMGVEGSWEGLVIPEPATMSLLGLGALALLRRRR